MLELTQESLEYAINECISKTGYRVILCSGNEEMVRGLFQQIQRDYADEVAFIKTARGFTLVYFINGSIIRFHTDSTSTIGQRCHLALFDREVSEEMRNLISHQFETIRWTEPKSSSRL